MLVNFTGVVCCCNLKYWYPVLSNLDIQIAGVKKVTKKQDKYSKENWNEYFANGTVLVRTFNQKYWK